MGNNGITAKEAREVAESSDFNAVEDALANINGDIKFSMKRKRTSVTTGILKDGIDSEGINFIISDLQGRGFEVKHSIYEATYYFDITW